MLEEHCDGTFSVSYCLLIIKNTTFLCYYITVDQGFWAFLLLGFEVLVS